MGVELEVETQLIQQVDLPGADVEYLLMLHHLLAEHLRLLLFPARLLFQLRLLFPARLLHGWIPRMLSPLGSRNNFPKCRSR